jgi:penicillin-binding protein 1A
MSSEKKKPRKASRRTGRSKRPAPRVKTWWVAAPVAVLALFGATSVAFVRAQNCPTIDAFLAYEPPEATRLFAADGSRLADLSPERRTVVSLEAIPQQVRDGFIAVEDRRFWEHGGVDVRGIGRAVVRDIRSLSLAEGFSTITMQLTRNVFTQELPRGDRLRRKVCEVVLARKIEGEYAKQEILRQYLNQVYMGGGLYGVEEASRAYFGKPAAEVTLPEAALLIGLVKNPEGYNPRRNRMRAIGRRSTVLEVMAREGVITAEQADEAKAAPIVLAPPPEAAGAAPYFVAAVRRELRARYGEDADVQGLRVYTALDPALQQAAHQALVAQIEAVEKGTYGRYRHAVPDSGEMEPADGEGSPYLQGMVLALDAHTGAVRALVGGRDFTHSSYDRAFIAKRQPGSAFKPIVYAAALQHGLTLAERIEATPVSVASSGGVWRPADGVDAYGSSLSAREALARSSNNAAVRVGQWVGAERVVDMAQALGLTTPIPPYPSIFLGAAEVVPAEFVAAYATLGNGGVKVSPQLIERIEDAHGTILWQAPEPAESVLDPGVAFLTVNMMEDVVDRGTGSAVRNAGFWAPAAGKTGTTNDAKDVWFVGMTPDLVAGVWLGFDQPAQITAAASGGQLAAPVWTKVMQAAYESRPMPDDWARPANVVTAAIDRATGKLASRDCPAHDVGLEYFLEGTQPIEFCPLHDRGGNIVDKLMKGLRRIF